MKMKLKRGKQASMPALDEGELAFATDTKAVYVGTNSGNSLVNPVDLTPIDGKLGDANEVGSETVFAKLNSLTASIQELSTSLASVVTTLKTVSSTVKTISTSPKVVKQVVKGVAIGQADGSKTNITITTMINSNKCLILLNNDVISDPKVIVHSAFSAALSGYTLYINSNYKEGIDGGKGTGYTFSWQIIEFY